MKHMKHIFLFVVVLLLVYKNVIQGPKEGFSFTENDILSSYGIRGMVQKDKNRAICKLKPKKRMILEKQSEIDKQKNEGLIMELKTQGIKTDKGVEGDIGEGVEGDIGEGVEGVEGVEGDIGEGVEGDIGEGVEGDIGEGVEGEVYRTEIPPNMPMNKENQFQGISTNQSMKIDTFDKQIETTVKEELDQTNPNNKLQQFMESMKKNEQKEIEQIKEINSQIKILDSEIKNSKEKDKVINKLIDKLTVTQPVVTPSKSWTNSIMYIMVITVLLIGGISIYFVMKGEDNPLGEPISFNEAVIKAKYNLLKRDGKV